MVVQESVYTLTPARVSEIFLACLFTNGEKTDKRIEAEGIRSRVGFHPGRLERYATEIERMLAELPNEFKQTGGGGWSFLNACNDRHGNLWTGAHQVMEQLFTLGIAIDRVKCLMPREMWSVLPGGMPYYLVLDSNVENEGE